MSEGGEISSGSGIPKSLLVKLASLFVVVPTVFSLLSCLAGILLVFLDYGTFLLSLL